MTIAHTYSLYLDESDNRLYVCEFWVSGNLIRVIESKRFLLDRSLEVLLGDVLKTRDRYEYHPIKNSNDKCCSPFRDGEQYVFTINDFLKSKKLSHKYDFWNRDLGDFDYNLSKAIQIRKMVDEVVFFDGGNYFQPDLIFGKGYELNLLDEVFTDSDECLSLSKSLAIGIEGIQKHVLVERDDNLFSTGPTRSSARLIDRMGY